jgi:lysyl-tRNA synthetase class 1
MHWADVIANKLKKLGEHIIATGITPSGPIHVGNMREVLTGDAVLRAMKNVGGNAKLLYVGDTFDQLRKVYPFLKKEYEEYVGMPLSEIPCPCSSHKSYAEHFLLPLLDALDTLGVEHETLLTHEMYKKGVYSESIKTVLENKEKIKIILENVSKRKLPENWFSYNPKCSKCKKFKTVSIKYEHPYVHYKCECGNEGKADIRKDDGKLPWRIDWPARWSFLNVTCEPFGKDHAAAGGSYDTGTAIIREIFGKEPPYPVVYEWVQLKGKGAMHSSTGVAVTASDMLSMTPPEVLRFMMVRTNPNKHIDFDPGFGLLNLVNLYDKYERIYFNFEEGEDDQKRVYELSQTGKAPEKMSTQIPYPHLVTVSQIKDSWNGVLDVLSRTKEISEDEKINLKQRYECVLFWLKNFAPESAKFRVQEKLENVIKERIDEEQKTFLKAMVESINKIEWTPDEIHTKIYDVSRSLNIEPKKSFSAIYLAILGKEKGPRLGYFLSSLDKHFVMKRFEEAVM